MRLLYAALFLLVTTGANAQTKVLTDCLNTQYGSGAWTQRTGQGQGTDIGPAITTCLQQIRSEGWGRGKIVIPPGVWLMNTPPDRNLLSGTYIEGYGSQASIVVFNNNGIPGGQVAFWWTGAGGFTGGGMKGIGLHLESGLGLTNSYGIMLRGDSSFQPDQMEFSDIYMSALGPSYWWTNLHVDGSARATPKGVRVGMFTNMQLFNARSTTAYFANAVSMTLTNFGCWTGIGPAPQTLYIDPASVQVSLRAVYCNGNGAP